MAYKNPNDCKAYQKQYRAKHKEKLIAYRKKYREQNKEKLNAQRTAWVAANPDKIATAQQKFREKHKDEINARNRVRRARDPEKTKEVQKRYREKHRDEINARNKQRRHEAEWSVRAFLQKILCRIRGKKHNCHKRAIEKYHKCNVTIDHLMQLWDNQKGQCALTGKHMVHKFDSPFAVSVDRIDSSQGYIQGNVQLVCQSVNYAKNHFTNEEFLNFWNNDKEQEECKVMNE